MAGDTSYGPIHRGRLSCHSRTSATSNCRRTRSLVALTTRLSTGAQGACTSPTPPTTPSTSSTARRGATSGRLRDLLGVPGALVSDEHDLVFTSNRGENTIGILSVEGVARVEKVVVGARPNGSRAIRPASLYSTPTSANSRRSSRSAGHRWGGCSEAPETPRCRAARAFR